MTHESIRNGIVQPAERMGKSIIIDGNARPKIPTYWTEHRFPYEGEKLHLKVVSHKKIGKIDCARWRRFVFQSQKNRPMGSTLI